MIRISFLARPAAPEARGTPRLLGLLSLAALVAASLASQTAQAGQTIKAQTQYKGSTSITVSGSYMSGNDLVNFGPVYAGRFETRFFEDPNDSNLATSTFDTYCIDLGTFNSPSTKTNAEVEVTNTTSGPTDSTNTVRNIGAAGWILTAYAGKTVSELQQAFSPEIGADIDSLDDFQAEAAIQIAIWLAAYSNANLTITPGSNATLAVALATAMNNNRGDETASVQFINYRPLSFGDTNTPTNQDMIGLAPEGSLNAVPEPSTLAMAAFGGVIGLGMMGRKRLMARKAKAMA